MGKRIFLLGLHLLICLFAVGCASPKIPVRPPRGILYTNYKAPLEVNYKDTAMEGVAGRGEARYIQCLYPYLSVGFDRGAIREIAAKKGIKKIDYVDYEYTSVFGLFQRVRFIPHGK